jgi:hypothetical protein
MNTAERILKEKFPSLEHLIRSSPCFDSKIVLGVHKGGSTMLHSFVQVYSEKLAETSKEFSSVNLSRMLFQGGATDEDFDDLSLIPKLIISHKSVCFYGWRQIPMSFLRFKYRLSRLRSVCLIRDPRDCAVSAYYSFLKTHRLPKDQASNAAQKIIRQRKEWANKPIDEYVLANISRFTQELNRVTAFAHPLLRIYKYEDIWQNKRWFFEEILRHLELPYDQASFDHALDRVDIKPGTDKSGHVRKGSPGDHKEKLSQSTIDSIDCEYRPLFELFGYT